MPREKRMPSRPFTSDDPRRPIPRKGPRGSIKTPIGLISYYVRVQKAGTTEHWTMAEAVKKAKTYKAARIYARDEVDGYIYWTPVWPEYGKTWREKVKEPK